MCNQGPEPYGTGCQCASQFRNSGKAQTGPKLKAKYDECGADDDVCSSHGEFQTPGLSRSCQCGHGAPRGGRWSVRQEPPNPVDFRCPNGLSVVERNELIHVTCSEPCLAYSKHSKLATFQVKKQFWRKCSVKYFNKDHVYSYSFMNGLPAP